MEVNVEKSGAMHMSKGSEENCTQGGFMLVVRM